MAQKPMIWGLSKTAGKQLGILVRRYHLTPDQITEMLDIAGEYAIDSYRQGLAAMEAVSNLIGEEAMEQMRSQEVAMIAPGDLRMVFDQMFPRKAGEKRRA